MGKKRYGRSLLNSRRLDKPAGLWLFVFSGKPKRESPPLPDEGGERAYITVPIRPQGTVRQAQAHIDSLVEEAREQAAEYLFEDTIRLERIGTTKHSQQGERV